MPSYPHWQPKTKLDDKLLILEDANHDGRADACKVFAGGLHQPTGFEIGRGGVFVAQQPDVLFLQDTNGDDVADVRIRKLIVSTVQTRIMVLRRSNGVRMVLCIFRKEPSSIHRSKHPTASFGCMKPGLAI